MIKFIKKYIFQIYIALVYCLILFQYPAGLALGRLAMHRDLASNIQPNYLLIWGLVRILIVLPLLFALLSREEIDHKQIYLTLGGKKRAFGVMKVTFWGTFIFTLISIVLYPWFIRSTDLTLLRFAEYLPIFLLYAISNAFIEETFFRGIAIRFLSLKNRFWIANVVQATFFALIHIVSPMTANPWPFVALTFGLGLLWGYLTKRTKSLLPAISLHVIADIFVAVSLF